MNKLIFAARTREALKSYAQMNNLNPNNYVLVEIPNALRQNRVVKSLVQNITNPDIKYVMVHKSCVTVTHNGKPALNVSALSENSYASSLNKPESEQIGDKTVGKDGNLKSLVVDIYNSNMSNKGKMAAFSKVKSVIQAQKQAALNAVVKSAIVDVENSNLGANEKSAALKSIRNFLAPMLPEPVTVNTALKSMLSDLNQSNLPLQIKNLLFNVLKNYSEATSKRRQKIDRSDEFVKVKNMGTAGEAPSSTEAPVSMSMKEKNTKTKSLGSLGSSPFERRDLIEENRELLKSLGSLSEEEGVFKNLHMARRYARLFNEKIASPNQRAEVVSPSIKDVQRFGKRVKARVNLV